MLKKLLLLTLLCFSPVLYASTSTSQKNFSGVYACKGNNSKVGDYSFTVTLKLNRRISRDDIYVYDVIGETENSTHYFGSALAIDNKMSLTFKISAPNENLSGVGLATFKLNQEKFWTFSTQYYEPDQDGGISGADTCTLQPAVAAKKALEDPTPNKDLPTAK